MAELPVKMDVPYKLLKNLMSLASMEEHSMLKLAGLTLVQEFLKSDQNGEVKLTFLQSGILEPLLLAFDKGLTSHPDLVYLEVSLNCIFFLSKLPIGPVQPLICEQVIKRLIQLIDHKSCFYQYLPNVKLNLQKMCENKHLVGQVQEISMNSDQWDIIHRAAKDQLKSIPHSPNTMCQCNVVDFGVCEKGLNIRQHLLSRNLAWACHSVVQTPKKDNEDDWRDILITHIVEGPVFWAQVGIETIQSAQKIQAILNVYWKNGALEHCGCKKGDCMVALHIIEGELCPIRISVKETNSREVQGWAIDYGQVLQVDLKHVFALPFEVRLDTYPPQISLCCIDGVQEPGESSIVGSGLAVLCNLTKRSFPAGNMFHQLGGLDVCFSLLKTCPVIDLRLQTCQLLCNLSCNSAISNKCVENQFIPVLIECLQEGFEMESSALQNELLLATLKTLSNLMYYNDVNRSIFYQYEGVEVVLKCSMLYGRSHPVYMAATKCIKMYICKALERNVIKDSTQIPRRSSLGKGGSSRGSRDTPLVMSRVLHEKSETDKFIWKPKAIEKVMDESRFQEVESSDDELVEQHMSLLDLKPKEQFETSIYRRPAMAVDVAEVYKSSQQREVFVLDSTVSIQNNSSNELRPNKSVSTISVNTVVQHACGMLNNGKGGIIYFGLSSTGKVLGIKLTREDRDEFRLGVDRMMSSRLQPCLLHSCFDVSYIPVVQKPADQSAISATDMEDIPDYFVAKIALTPAKGTLYIVTPGEECYYRFGARTTSLSIQELRHLIILEEEEEFRDKIKQLATNLMALQQQLSSDS